MKTFLTFIGCCAVTLLVALKLSGAQPQTGLKISQYPQVLTPQAQYLFVIADPNQTNYSIRYDNLRLAIIQGLTVDLTQATNNDRLYSNALSAFIISIVAASTNNISLLSATNNDILYSNALSAFITSLVQSSTNVAYAGFVFSSSGFGTNLTLRGTNIVQEFDTAFLVSTNVLFPTNYTAPWPAAPTDYGEAFFGNSNGTIYLLQSKVNALTWTKTNLISSP